MVMAVELVAMDVSDEYGDWERLVVGKLVKEDDGVVVDDFGLGTGTSDPFFTIGVILLDEPPTLDSVSSSLDDVNCFTTRLPTPAVPTIIWFRGCDAACRILSGMVGFDGEDGITTD